MTRSARAPGLFLLVLGMALLLGSVALAAGESVLARIQAADQPFDNLQVEAVRELTPRTVTAGEPYQGGSFQVLARKESIERFRCNVCHTGKPVLVQEAGQFTHGDITLGHGQAGASLSCRECHHPEDRDFLVDSQGRKIDFDHSYQLCGKCHFREKRDWVGGAHGKREGYWTGERVVHNCTGCHNPHSPGFDTKMPATYSVPPGKQVW
jgi:hypothetical protein